MIRVRLDRARRFPRAWRAPVAAAILWLALVGVYEIVATRRGIRESLCIFRRITGIPCPTCGATRAVKHLLVGDPAGALAMNPLLVVAGVVAAAILLLRLCAGRALRVEADRRTRIAAGILLAVLAAANWAYLIAFVG